MRRLKPGQPVVVDLDSTAESIPCSVVSVAGQAALLSVAGPLGPALMGRLAAGSPGYLLFSDRGAPIGLRGAAAYVPGRPEIEFRVTDGVELPERRDAPRTALTTRATLTLLPADGQQAQRKVDTTTINVSLTGVLLRRTPELEGTAQFAVKLYFGADETPVESTASLARATDTGVALHFTALAADEKQRLAEFLAGYRIANRLAGSERF